MQRVVCQQVETKKMLAVLHEFSIPALIDTGHPLVEHREIWFSFHASAMFFPCSLITVWNISEYLANNVKLMYFLQQQ